MSKMTEPTALNNTPNVTETVPNDAPMEKLHRRGCPTSSKGIVKEWWWLRITAALLVPLSIWFLAVLLTRLLGAEPETLVQLFANPLWVAVAVLLLLTGFIHTRLGVHEIIIDYVHAPAKKKACNLLVDFLSLALGLGSIAAVIQLHLMA